MTSDRQLYDVYLGAAGTECDATEYLMTAPITTILNVFSIRDSEARAAIQSRIRAEANKPNGQAACVLHFARRNNPWDAESVSVLMSLVARP